MLLFQVASFEELRRARGTGSCYVIASTAKEVDQILDTLDLRPSYDEMRADGRDHAVIPGTRLARIAAQAQLAVADRVTPDPIGALFAGRYQYSLQMAAERTSGSRGEILILREIAPDGAAPFEGGPRGRAEVLVDCGGWTCAAHLNDADDPECRSDGWATDNGWAAMAWPPKRYLPLPTLPAL